MHLEPRAPLLTLSSHPLFTLPVAQAVGVAAGALGAWGMLVFRRAGASADPRRNAAALFGALFLEVAPLTAGGALLYTATSCTLEANRGVRDWQNSVRLVGARALAAA